MPMRSRGPIRGGVRICWAVERLKAMTGALEGRVNRFAGRTDKTAAFHGTPRMALQRRVFTGVFWRVAGVTVWIVGQ